MTVLNTSYKFISNLWDKSSQKASKSSVIVPETEEDKKLQKELDLMLSSLEKNNINNTKKMNKVEIDDDCKEFSLQEALYGLIEQIQQASKRTLDNQIVNPSSNLQRQLDVASLCGLVDRMNKKRLKDQVRKFVPMRLLCMKTN